MTDFLDGTEYDVKKFDFGKFAEYVKWNTAAGKYLRSARYRYEVKPQPKNPQLTFVNEWLEIKSDGYLYKINVRCNSQYANECQLMAVLMFPDKIQGLLSKEEY